MFLVVQILCGSGSLRARGRRLGVRLFVDVVVETEVHLVQVEARGLFCRPVKQVRERHVIATPVSPDAVLQSGPAKGWVYACVRLPAQDRRLIGSRFIVLLSETP